jgi:CheY-like chemotaxis protein
MVAISAADGNEGMSKAIVHSPDLIITDFMMPGIDGLEVCWRVRADERLQNVRLLLWSAVRGIDAGVSRPGRREVSRSRCPAASCVRLGPEH